MLIIELKRARKHLVEVVLEDESIFIDSELAIIEKLKVGIELNQTDIETLKYKSDFIRAKSKSLWYLSRREYSKKELIDKMKCDFDINALTEAVELLAEAGVVSDERFAESYAYDLSNIKKLSKRSIIYELTKKGVERSLAEEVAENSSGDEIQKIIDIITLRYKTYAEDEKIKRRMFSALARKGYSFDSIKKAVNTIEENF